MRPTLGGVWPVSKSYLHLFYMFVRVKNEIYPFTYSDIAYHALRNWEGNRFYGFTQTTVFTVKSSYLGLALAYIQHLLVNAQNVKIA